MSQTQAASTEVFLHLSPLLGWMIPIPFIDIAIPIIIWQTTKKQSPQIEPHARNVVNWLISSTIYSLILLVTLVGTPLLPVLWGLRFVFPIIGAIQASQGKVWAYPITIDFLGARPERQLKRAAIGFLSLAVVPLAALSGSIIWLNSRINWLDSLSSTTGTVTEILEEKNDEGYTVYRPVVEFEGTLGDSYDISPWGWTRPPIYQLGESVDVLYKPSEPHIAIIDRWVEKWSLVTTALALSSLALGFAIIPSICCLILSRVGQ